MSSTPLGTRGRATWSSPRLCPAGCSRRPESSGWEMSHTTASESPLPPQRTPSPTLWWVQSWDPWQCVCLWLSRGLFAHSRTFIPCKRRSTASSSRCCLRAAGFPLTETIFSWSLWGLIPSSGLTSRKTVSWLGCESHVTPMFLYTIMLSFSVFCV